MALRTRAPAPIPKAELRALLDRLPTAYASRLWYGDGQAVLVARVPREEPDLIQDVEHVVEHAHPDHVEEADQCLLVGTRAIHGVPMTPLRSLMADRVAFDRRQCAMLRTQLPDAPSHTRYRAPDDPQRRLRLALRVPGDHVADADEEALDVFVDRLGPLLEVGELDGLHCVYVIASQDDVRLEADTFLTDLLERWQAPERQERLAAARQAQTEARAAAHTTPPTPPPDSPGPSEDGPASPSSEQTRAPPPPVAEAEHRLTVRSRDDMRSIQHQVDALDADGWTDSDDRPGPPGADAVGGLPLPRREAEGTGSPRLDRLRATLDRQGFDVLVRPDVPGHAIDLAAERPEGDPQRVVAVECEVLDDAGAQTLLAAGRELDVDLVLALCEEVTPEAGRRLVATKVRTLTRDDLAELRL